MIAHREPGAELEAYAALKTPARWAASLDPDDQAGTAGTLLERFNGWDPRLLTLITEADEPFVPRPIHALPVGHQWDRVAGVTLLGDAAHLMSPFAGEGANLAMRDGADLAARLIEHGTTHHSDIENALGAYEAEMFPRAAAAAAESNLIITFRPDAPQGLLDVMASHGVEPLSSSSGPSRASVSPVPDRP